MAANPTLTFRMRVLLRERAPVAAMCAVGVALQAATSVVAGAALSWHTAIPGGLGVAAVLVVLRLMDEVKDVDKDRLAHPERPLPRGLVTVGELRRTIRWLGAAMFVHSGIVAVFADAHAGALYAATTAYAFLMYREFFAPRVLARNAFAYALVHQILILPLCLFAAALAARDASLTPRSYWFAVACTGASFTFELARKLDPGAHHAVGTYIQRHGRAANAVALTAALAVFAFGAFGAGLGVALLPFLAIAVAALGIAAVRPAHHQWASRAAAALVFALLLVPTFLRVFAHQS